MAKLFFVSLEGTENSYQLHTHRPFTVGRDPSNDIVVRDPKVSRRHMEIVFERGFFVIHDLASANGTFVNGRRVRIAPLVSGAKLRIGNTYGEFTDEAGEQPAASPAPVASPQQQLEEDATYIPDPAALNLATVPHEQIGASVKKN